MERLSSVQWGSTSRSESEADVDTILASRFDDVRGWVVYEGYSDMNPMYSYRCSITYPDCKVHVALHRRYEGSILARAYLRLALADAVHLARFGNLRHGFKWYRILLTNR